MRSTALLVCFLLTSPLFAQWILKPIAPTLESKKARVADDLPAINLPFWDDFYQTGDVPGELWEHSEGVFVNATLGIGSPSYKVATLDGIDANGQVYSENELYPGLTDQLMSRKIDLSAFAFDNSIYLSFFWEMGGNGEIPEASGDSLRLQFQKADGSWTSVWKRQATQVTTTDAFAQSILQVTADYRHAEFRFKFESFGSLQGPFDTWHIDYVYLNSGRFPSHISYKDRTFTGSISSLFEPYQSMPANQFFLDPAKYLSDQKFQGYNLEVENPNPFNVDYELRNTNTGETFTIPEDINTFPPGQLLIGNLSPPSIPAQYPAPDSIVFYLKLSSNFSDADSVINLSVNDSISVRYNLYDYFSYDDGTAEFAAGVRQNGTVAMEFNVETKDTLTHIDIHFPAVIPSSTNTAITVYVWTDLAEDPVSAKPYTITASGRNEFQRITLSTPVVVEDKVYIGYTQKAADFVGIGLDRSNPSANDKIFFKIDADWEQNDELNGVLMMRAVFEDDPTLVLGTSEPKRTFQWYPNPTNGFFKIGEAYSSMSVWTLEGKRVFEEARKDTHDLSILPSGVYLLKVSLPDNTTHQFKLVKK